VIHRYTKNLSGEHGGKPLYNSALQGPLCEHTRKVININTTNIISYDVYRLARLNFPTAITTPDPASGIANA
jgi:hypothetical protein